MLDLNRFEVLTFDCYGTLIDWERGIIQTLRPLLKRHGVEADDRAIMLLYAKLEEAAERPPYRPYRAVLQQVVRGFGERYRFEPSSQELSALAESVPTWQPFADTVAGLGRLQKRYRIGIISNIDDDLFAATAPKLGVKFDYIITAQSVGSYKPDPKNFTTASERIGIPQGKWLHAAQSLLHDIVPANALGIATVWVNRRGAVHGFGTLQPVNASPDLVVEDLKSLADMADRADAAGRPRSTAP